MKTLTADEAERLLDSDNGTELYGYRKVDDTQISTGRWTEYRWLVLADAVDGTLYGADYELGLTEMQEADPFYGTVTLKRLERVPVTTYEYRQVSA